MSNIELVLIGAPKSTAEQIKVAKSLKCEVKKRGVYPVISGKSDIKLVLMGLFNRQTSGWENYKNKMIELGICPEDYIEKNFQFTKS